MSQTGVALQSLEETVGSTGTGSFTQSGGTNTVIFQLRLGDGASSSGTYNLSSTGSLSATTEIIGNPAPAPSPRAAAPTR